MLCRQSATHLWRLSQACNLHGRVHIQRGGNIIFHCVLAQQGANGGAASTGVWLSGDQCWWWWLKCTGPPGHVFSPVSVRRSPHGSPAQAASGRPHWPRAWPRVGRVAFAARVVDSGCQMAMLLYRDDIDRSMLNCVPDRCSEALINSTSISRY